MKFYSDGIFYHVKIHQNKESLPYLCLLHGFMGSGNIFNRLLSLIKPFCNPVTTDLLGHGKSEGSTEPQRYQAKKQVLDMASILQRLNLENLFLYGYSMGGRLALQILIHSKAPFNGVILESSSCGIESPEARLSRKKADDEKSAELRGDFNRFLRNWTGNPLFKNNLDDDYIQIFKDQNPEFIAACLEGFGSGVMPPVCSRLNTLTIPALLIAGEEDDKYREIMYDMSNKFGNAKFDIIRNAGHRIHYDNPNELAEKLRYFLVNPEK